MQRLSMKVICLCALLSSIARGDGVLVYGDSLSAAYGLSPQQGWVAHLAQALQQQVPPVAVINASISGETTAGGLQRIDRELATHTPDVVLLELGANDGLRGMPIAQIKANLEHLIQAIERTDAEVILLGIRLPPNYGERYTQPFFELYADLAQRYELRYLPFLLEGIAQHSHLMQDDGLHPTAQAQIHIMQQVLPWVLDSLMAGAQDEQASE